MTTSYCMFEHEVGRKDWALKSLGGEILDAQIMHGWNENDQKNSKNSNTNIMFTISEKILAATNRKSGTNLWRKEISQDHGPTQLQTFRNYVMIFDQRNIQVFRANNGKLILSINEQDDIDYAQVFVSKTSKKSNSEDESTATVIATLSNGDTVVYKNAKEQARFSHKYEIMGSDSTTLYGLTYSNGKFIIHTIDILSGEAKQTNQVSLKASGDVSYKSNSEGFYILTAVNDEIKSVEKIAYDGTKTSLKVQKGLKSSDVTINENSLLASKGKTSSLGKFMHLSNIIESKFTFESTENSLEVFEDGMTPFTINTISFKNNGNVKSVFELEENHYLIQMADYTLNYIENFSQKWGRHEGIANIEKFKFIDINEDPQTKSEIISYMHNLESMDDNLFNLPMKIMTRYIHHLEQLKNLVLRTEPIASKEVDADKYGFKKILLGLTKTHDTLLALQSNTGELKWDLHLSKIIKDATILSEEDDFIEQSDFHLIEKENEKDEVIAILSSKSGNSMYLVLDPFTGIIKEAKVNMNKKITNSFKLQLDSLHQIVLMIDSNKVVTSYPKDRPLSADIDSTNSTSINSFSKNISFHEFTQENNKLELVGYNFNTKNCPESAESCLSMTWRIPFHGQKLLTYADNDVHPQQATNLNGAILYKYLEPSLFALAMTTQHSSNDLYIYLIEGSTGRVVHQFYERNVLLTRPVNLILDENSLIISFQRMGKLGEGTQQFQSISFYEQDIKFSARDVIVDYITGKNSSKLYGEMPIVVQNAYTFQYSVKSIGITRTVQGITGKNLLLVMENDQVYALDKFDTDTTKYLRKLSKMARERHEKQQKEAFDHSITDSLDMDDEEELDEQGEAKIIDSYLRFNPLAIISHRHELIGLEKVETAPSRLESTSLTVTYGIDIFYTLVAPEKQFDILSEDFRKDYLILTIIGLVVISRLVGWYFNRNKHIAKMHQE